MLDLTKITYKLVVMDENKKQYNIKDFVTNLGWEENEGELALRISFTVKNDDTSVGKLSSLIKPGCMIGVLASDGDKEDEVARGYVVTWKSKESISSSDLDCKCYDELYNLQQSQDYIYYSAGIGTKSAISQIFVKWGIPIETYDGPNVSHSKLTYKSQYLSDVLLDILDDAKKKGGGDSIIRARKGKVSVLRWGTNHTIYVFEPDNTKVVSHSISTAGMITRVKVIGQANDDEKSSVEATLNGLTKYGIRQKIYTRNKDDSLDDETTEAHEIFNEYGKLKEEITVQSPDIPFIRKGDLVYLKVASLQSYYFVMGIQHDAEACSMTMNLKKAEQENIAENQSTKKKTYKVGDIVNFHGGMNYISSYPGAKGHEARAGKAKITIINGSGKAHPWHLIHVDNGDVYGWVDDGTFD